MRSVRRPLNWTPFLPHQRKFFDWEPKGRVSREAVLGGWGSGKTTCAARKFMKRALALNWHEGYGQTRRPQAIVMAPSSRILRKATQPAIEELIPREIIMDRKKAPHPMILLTNGLEISFVSGEAGFEGEDVALFYIDEISHHVFARNPERFVNFMARLRDPHATGVMSMIVSGIPLAGWTREIFDQPNAADLHTMLCGTRDNPHIPPETVNQLLASCPSGYEEAYIKGGWMPVPDAVFPQFDSSIHLTDMAGDPHRPVSIGIDVGNHGAVVFGQTISIETRNVMGQTKHGTGLLIVDELITSELSVDAMCHAIKMERPWIIDRSHSSIMVDPTSRRDELAAIRRHFPATRIIQRDRKHELYQIEAGVRVVQRGLRDAHGNVRLLFNRGLSTHRHGVIDALQNVRRHAMSQRVVKDDRLDHPCDALRYLVQEHLRGRMPETRVL